jgi:hypothetical protein
MTVLVIQWLHVLLGIFWFGGSLYLNFMVVPVVLSLPLGARSNQVLPLVAILVILLGLLRGTIWGPVHTFVFLFGTTYGVTFLTSLLVASGVELWGHFVTMKAGTTGGNHEYADLSSDNWSRIGSCHTGLQR